MATPQYIGARYVPMFADPAEWSSEVAYEALTIVIHQGNSFTSRQAVPVGIPLNDERYWVETGNYNAQVEGYRQIVLTFNQRISEAEGNATQALEDIAAEVSARTAADQALQTSINTSINTEATTRAEADQALQTSLTTLGTELNGEIDAINANDWVTRERIAPNAVGFDNLDAYVQGLHKPAISQILYCYIAGSDTITVGGETITVSDATGQPSPSGDYTHPFKTLDAAFQAAMLQSNDIRLYFLTGGTFTWTTRIISGCVIHMFLEDNNTTGWHTGAPVFVNVQNEYGSLFFYDTHLNLHGIAADASQGTTQRDITLTATHQIQFEGSTLWSVCSTITCEKLYLVQGSAHLSYSTYNCPIEALFANVRLVKATINNTSNARALYATCGFIRFEGTEDTPDVIMRNPNSVNLPAIEVRNCVLNLNTLVNYGYVRNLNYSLFFEARGSILVAPSTEAALALYTSLGGYSYESNTLWIDSNKKVSELV